MKGYTQDCFHGKIALRALSEGSFFIVLMNASNT